nr:MAG TPA: hypothetical protein [Caudoviricetes sp.]
MTVKEIAQRMKASDIWEEADCKALCELAGFLDEYNNADGESFECIVVSAADKLGVDII